MDVSIIIVTYRSASCISECVRSVLEQERTTFEVIVVDNASSDGTLKMLAAFGNKISVLPNPQNVGFGRACNQGFDRSEGRCVYFLNPDAQLVQRNGLARLCAFLDENPRLGMAGTGYLEAAGRSPKPATTYPGQKHAQNDFARLPGKIAW